MISNSDMIGPSISEKLSTDHAPRTDFVRVLHASLLSVRKCLTRYSSGVLARRMPRRLRVAETVSLGEKRFVSILQVDGEQFLVGGSPSSVVLLAKLEGKPEVVGEGFENVISRLDSDAIRRRARLDELSEVVQ